MKRKTLDQRDWEFCESMVFSARAAVRREECTLGYWEERATKAAKKLLTSTK